MKRLLSWMMLGPIALAAASAAPEGAAPDAARPEPPRVVVNVMERTVYATTAEALPTPGQPARRAQYLSLYFLARPGTPGAIPIRVQVRGLKVAGTFAQPEGTVVEQRPDGISASLVVDPQGKLAFLTLSTAFPDAPALPEGLAVQRSLDTLPDGRRRLTLRVRSPIATAVYFPSLRDAEMEPKVDDATAWDCRDGKSFTVTFRPGDASPSLPPASLTWTFPRALDLPKEPAVRHELHVGSAVVTVESEREFALSLPGPGASSRMLSLFLGERRAPALPLPRASLLLADMEEDTANWQLSRDTSALKEGKSSGRWQAGRVAAVTSAVLPEDWAAYPRLAFWLWASAPLRSPLEVVVRSDNPGTPEEDGYRASVPVRGAGWQRVSIAREQFAAVGAPAGWEHVGALTFRAPKGLPPQTTLRLDEVRISRE